MQKKKISIGQLERIQIVSNLLKMYEFHALLYENSKQ